MRMSGYTFRTRDHSRSDAALQMFMGCKVIITSTGASGAVMATPPMSPNGWIAHLFVAQRLPQRVPRLAMKARVAELDRVLREGERVAPLGSYPPYFLGTEVGAQRIGSAIGMNRPGFAPHHSSTCQSL